MAARLAFLVSVITFIGTHDLHFMALNFKRWRVSSLWLSTKAWKSGFFAVAFRFFVGCLVLAEQGALHLVFASNLLFYTSFVSTNCLLCSRRYWIREYKSTLSSGYHEPHFFSFGTTKYSLNPVNGSVWTKRTDVIIWFLLELVFQFAMALAVIVTCQRGRRWDLLTCHNIQKIKCSGKQLTDLSIWASRNFKQ